jgi:2'-hydroxyisoflavone reductase
MQFLILGGTNFVGRHLAERAKADGHGVTLFNRGRTNPGIFEDVEEVHGDRDGGLNLLIDEDSPVATMPDVAVEDVTRDTYGPLKALCEDVVQSVYKERCTIVRPGIVAGPFDDTDRFTYWCVRASKGGEFVAPDDAARPVQFIDARDLAAFTLKASEASLHGVFNATGPQEEAVEWGDLVARCVEAGGSDARAVCSRTGPAGGRS